MTVSISDLFVSAEKRVVALETVGEKAVAFIRTKEGEVLRKEFDWSPFIILRDPALLNGFGGAFRISSLEGGEDFSFLAEFQSVSDYEKARKHLKETTGFSPGSPYAPWMILSDPVQQALIRLKIRLFSMMGFHEVRRMQIDIETLCAEGYDFPNAEREEDAVIAIAMSDSSGWERVLSVREEGTEKFMLEEFVRVLRERDPDILEGHNFFRFDLPYLETRAKRHRVKLSLGRDGSVPKKRTSRFNVAERTVNYTRYDIFGRHIADTYHLALFYDAVRRDLDGYGLKTIARHFRVASEERVYVDASCMKRLWAEDPGLVLRYCLDDVRETRAISDILSPSSFYQTQIIPLSYQNCILRGNATKIDSIFLAEYLDAGHSLPSPERARPFSGALTRSFRDGVFDGVMHCDVRSLYPSIILSENWSPSRDRLGVFVRFLRSLRSFRLEAKDAERAAQDKTEREYYRSLQSAFKILINSFYGYLGFEQGFLNDFDMAERVTARGREILTSMLDFLTSHGAQVIEMDTDGIYFQPPPGEDVSLIREELGGILPDGIDVDFDESYRSMFSYKSKNYALLKENGEMSISGAALKSRGLEPFQRQYMRQLIQALLHHDPSSAASLYEHYRAAIAGRTIPLAELAKSETLSDSLEGYKRKLQSSNARRSAAYELAIRSGREYRQGDQVSFYITGSKKKLSVVDNSKLLSDADENVRDENVEYYLDKLEELRKKFEPFTGSSSVPEEDLFASAGERE